MIHTLLATADQLARPLSSDEIWAGIFRIFFSAVFTIILIWVIMKIWNGEWWNDGEKPTDDIEKKE